MSAQRTSRFRNRQPDPKYMTFVEHLQELRQRLIVSLSSIAVGSVVGWLLASRVIRLLDEPLKEHLKGYDGKLITPQVYGGFTLNLKIAIAIGFIIALPVTLSQIWAFVAPAFGPR